MNDYQDLGWANNWPSRIWTKPDGTIFVEKEDTTPDIIKQCRALSHTLSDVDIGPPHRGLEHVVKCQICGYVYRYDSSD